MLEAGSTDNVFGSLTDLISKKRVEKQLKTYRAYANDLNALQMTMEAQEDQKEFTRSLASASKIIKGSRLKGAVGAVDEYNETMTECADEAHELDEALSGGRIWSDESAIDAELKEMFGDDETDEEDMLVSSQHSHSHSHSRPPTGPTGSALMAAHKELEDMPDAPTSSLGATAAGGGITDAVALLSD